MKSSLEDLRNAIAQLDSTQRAALLASFRELPPPAYEVREAALQYGLDPAEQPQPDRLMSVEEYLEFEEHSQIRHEYLGGQVFAMSGATLRHNVITGNLYGALRSHLQGSPCRTFLIDAKCKLSVHRDEIFYYPDLMVACGNLDLSKNMLREPRLVVEVLSPSTEKTDRREKSFHYRQIDSVEEHMLIAQRMQEVTLYRRAEQWKAYRWTDAAAMVELRSMNLALPLAKIYENV